MWTIYLSTFAGNAFMEMIVPVSCGLLQPNNAPTTQKWIRNGSRSTIRLSCWLRFQEKKRTNTCSYASGYNVMLTHKETHIRKYLPTEGPKHSCWYLHTLIISAVRVHHGTACSTAAKYITFSYFLISLLWLISSPFVHLGTPLRSLTPLQRPAGIINGTPLSSGTKCCVESLICSFCNFNCLLVSP